MRKLPYLHSQCQKPSSMPEVYQILENIFQAKTFLKHATVKHRDEMPQSSAQTSA